jgi:tetratricopeptide (TPR) repeat protein
MRVLALLFATGFAVCSQNPLQEAVTLTRAGRYAEAHQALKNAAEPSETGQRIAFHRLKAAVASGLSEFREAAAEMQSALQLSPADSNLLLAAAVAELKAGQTDAALNHARSAGESPVALALIGDIEEKRGNTAAAIAAYRQAAALAPANEQYPIALASELIQHQAFGPAITAIEQARPTFPRSAKLMVLLAIAHYAAGDTREAIDSLTDAIALEPSLEAAYLCLSQIVLQSASAPPEKVFHSLCAWNTNVCAALQLRQARETSDDTLAQQAIDQLKRAPKSDSVAHCALGRAYAWRRQLLAARRELELCAAQDGSPQNIYVLALLYQRMGETVLARKELAARDEQLRRMSEQTTAGLKALHTIAASLASPSQ